MQQALQGCVVRGFDFQPQIRRLGIGEADPELLHLESAAVLHDLVEDVLHDMGVDQVALGFDHFVEWHRNSIVV